MKWNGILVTTEAPQHDYILGTNYRGVAYGKPWPLNYWTYVSESNLSDDDHAIIKEINNLTAYLGWGNDIYVPWLIADIGLVHRYISRCQYHDIKLRFLLCKTPRGFPRLSPALLQELRPYATLLGYDYAYQSCGYSAVLDDLNPASTPRLEELKLHLNQWGLFDNLSILSEYISARWQCIVEERQTLPFGMGGYPLHPITSLEDCGDFVHFEVYELDPSFQILLGDK